MTAMAIVSLAAIGLVASPAQAQAVQCTGGMQNTVIHGDLEVPDGAACQLVNVKVLGDASAGVGADLVMERTMVRNVTAAASAFVFADRSVLNGTVTLTKSFGLSAANSMILDDVSVEGADPFTTTLFFAEGTNVIGNVKSSLGWTVLQDGMINGSLATAQDQATDLFRMRVKGLSVDQAADGSVLCDTHSNGDAWVTNSHGFIQLGGPYTTLMCAGNKIVGDLQVHDNTATDIQISANLITQDLACTGNTPAPAGHSNIVLGKASGQCADIGTVHEGLIPPPGAPGEVEAVTEGERVAVPTELVQERLAAAREAAPIPFP
jgi:hypothetical protein